MCVLQGYMCHSQSLCLYFPVDIDLECGNEKYSVLVTELASFTWDLLFALSWSCYLCEGVQALQMICLSNAVVGLMRMLEIVCRSHIRVLLFFSKRSSIYIPNSPSQFSICWECGLLDLQLMAQVCLGLKFVYFDTQFCFHSWFAAFIVIIAVDISLQFPRFVPYI
jgi:hypothetical protein